MWVAAGDAAIDDALIIQAAATRSPGFLAATTRQRRWLSGPIP